MTCIHQLILSATISTGPRCLPAATMTSISHHTQILNTEFYRQLPIYKDGVDTYDIQTLLSSEYNLDSLTFTAPPEGAIRLLKAGYPTVAMTHKRNQKHAVTIAGLEYLEQNGECTDTVKSLGIIDPNVGVVQWVPLEQFASMQYAQQMLVVFPASDRDKLDDAGFPTHIAEQVDKRFRSNALIKRAESHGEMNAQAKTLLTEAYEIDPTNPYFSKSSQVD